MTAQAEQTRDSIERTVDNVNGQNIMGDFRPSDLFGTAGSLTGWALTHPLELAKASLGFWGELGKIAAGQSKHTVEPGDRRFSDPAWKESSLYSGLLQGYLALRQSMDKYAADSNLDERAHFLLDQVGDALAPSNFLLGNPAALRRLKETRGLSLARGAKNLLNDVRKRRPIPSQVDETAFKVGENLAMTPGSVVLRTEMFELIQYAPQTEQVHQRPVLVVPSIVNKYYVFDLAPKRSILEYYVQKGMTVFVVVWRNPQPRHDRWGMSDYQDAVDTAVDAACSITHSEDVNLWAVCGAGPVAVSLAGYYAAKATRKINSLLLVVSPLDMHSMAEAPTIGAFVDPQEGPTNSPIKKALRNKRISATEFTLLFAMLRANELIWNYWVSNYLLGNAPPAFDILFWNNDTTSLPARLHSDYLDLITLNPFRRAGALTLSGTPIDMGKVVADTYVVAGVTDHITPWKSVYQSARILGDETTFVLSNAGHLQSLINPPGNPKATFVTGKSTLSDPEAFVAGAAKQSGSWWRHWSEWLSTRSEGKAPAPAGLGDASYPAREPAPGTYVFNA